MVTDGFEHLKVEISEGIAKVRLDRAGKRNAVNRKMLSELDRFFSSPPSEVKAAWLSNWPGRSAGTLRSPTIFAIQAIPRISDMSAILSHHQDAIELRPGIAEFLGKK